MNHLVIGTPMYGGMCHAGFADSVARLQRERRIGGDLCSTIYISNESLIQRARNAIVWHFLQNPDATHLLFCDADQSFRAEDVTRMINAEVPVIIGPVPMKTIDWVAVWKAATICSPRDLPYAGAKYNFEPPFPRDASIDEPFKIERGGSGFMLIKREVFETLKRQVVHYFNDLPGQDIPPDAGIGHYFQVYVEKSRLLSEDYAFCDLATNAGFDIYLAPWCEISHFGTHEFKGRLYGGRTSA